MAERKTTGGWAACKSKLKGASAPELLNLIHDLYKLEGANRHFLHLRLVPTADCPELEGAKRRLARMLSANLIYKSEFSHMAIKKFINQFEKASGDPAAVADLILSGIEDGVQSLDHVGGCEPMVDHLYAQMDRLDSLLPKLSHAKLVPLVERLGNLSEAYGASFGYGLSDELNEFAAEWKERMGSRGGLDQAV